MSPRYSFGQVVALSDSNVLSSAELISLEVKRTSELTATRIRSTVAIFSVNIAAMRFCD
jgi:hypothetical protein